MGIGGDQGGSIRIVRHSLFFVSLAPFLPLTRLFLQQPASLCGIVGLKPTFGLVPYTGVLSSDSGVDHVGPMSKTVYDAALLLEAIAGYDNIDDRQLGAPLPGAVPKYSKAILEKRKMSVKGLKIGLLREGFSHKSLDKAVDETVRAAIAKFEELGAVVEEVSVPLFVCILFLRLTSADPPNLVGTLIPTLSATSSTSSPPPVLVLVVKSVVVACTSRTTGNSFSPGRRRSSTKRDTTLRAPRCLRASFSLPFPSLTSGVLFFC